MDRALIGQTHSKQGTSTSNTMLPVKLDELFTLQNIGIDVAGMSLKTVTMESDRYICVRDIVNKCLDIINLNDVDNTKKVRVTCDFAIINPSNLIIALLFKKSESLIGSGYSSDPTVGMQTIQIFSIDLNTSIKSIHVVLGEDVILMKWISPNVICYVTNCSVYHCNIDGEPKKIFCRHVNLKSCEIINYRTDSTMKWCVLIGICGQSNLVTGSMQLYSTELGISQFIEGHTACFTRYKMKDDTDYCTLFCFVNKDSGSDKMKLQVVNVQTNTKTNAFNKRSIDFLTSPEILNDFPVAIQVNEKHSIIFVITMFGYMYLFDIETGTNIYQNKISTDAIFATVPHDVDGGVICINRKGKVILISIDSNSFIPYITNVLKNNDLATSIVARNADVKCDSLLLNKFNDFIENKQYLDAVNIAVNSPNEVLRTEYVLQRFLQIPQDSGEAVNPIIKYFSSLLDNGKQLNFHESIELCKIVLKRNKKNLLEKWLTENSITCSETLGDIVKPYDNKLALSIFLRANVPDKVIKCFIETNETCEIISYCKKLDFKPDYINILRDIITHESREESPVLLNDSFSITSMNFSKVAENSINFAKILIGECFKDESYDEKLLCMNTIVNIFVSKNKIKECTAFLLEVLKDNKPSESHLQTKLIAINLQCGESRVADAILSNKMFTHYDKNYIGHLCEKHFLLEQALQHYTDLYDIKRTLIQTDQLNQEFIVDYFSKLSVEDALECLKVMLSTNVTKNLNICVKICNKYYKQLTTDSVIELFEMFKCYEGLYHFFESIVMSENDDNDVSFKYLQSACKIGQIKEVERICRNLQFNSPEKVKNYLKEIELSDYLPLIIICDRYNYVEDLVFYLYRNNLLNYLEIYVQNENPSRLPLVIGMLLDVDCNENCIKSLIMMVKVEQFSCGELINEIEKRNRLKLLVPWLELLVSKGSVDEAVHNAVAKIYIDTNNNSERFLRENQYYNSTVIGKYCEKRDPQLACIVYERGKCDLNYIDTCFENNLFKMAARYLVRRCDQILWSKVLIESGMNGNVSDLDKIRSNRKQLIDQVIQISSATLVPEELSATVKAFMAADLPNELMEILEKVVIDNVFSENKSLQNLLLLTAIKCDKKKLVSYIQRLDNYDTKDIAITCIQNQLFEEAFIIYKKFSYNTLAVRILIENLQNLDRAYEFAEYCNEPAVWSLLGQAQLRHSFIKGGIDSFVRADDASSYANVIETAQKTASWHDLVRYLEMAHKKLHEPYIESELIYTYAKTNRLDNLKEILSVSNHADLLKLGDRCFDSKMYEAAKILYSNVSHYAKLAIALAKLNELRDAVENARKANCTKTWKEVCFICLDKNEFRLAQICGLNIVVHADELQSVIDYYEKESRYDELIDLLEAALGLERAHMGIFTELSILYAKYTPDKMEEHAELFWCRLNIPKVLKSAEEAHLWYVSSFLYYKYEDYDNAVMIIINHPTESWRENHFKDLITKVSNNELHYKIIRFYFTFKPLLLNDILFVLSSRLDYTKLIMIFNELNCLKLVKPYLLSVQALNNKAVNEVLNGMLIEEEDYQGLRNSIDMYDNIDSIMLAQKLEKHELIEFKRLSAYLYKKSSRWEESIEISKQEKLYKDAIKYASESKSSSIAEKLLIWFLENNLIDYFSALHFHCYDLLRPDMILELSWKHNITCYAMPYFIQTVSDYVNKFDKMEKQVQINCDMIKEVYNIIKTQKEFVIPSDNNNSQLMLTNREFNLQDFYKNN